MSGRRGPAVPRGLNFCSHLTVAALLGAPGKLSKPRFLSPTFPVSPAPHPQQKNKRRNKPSPSRNSRSPSPESSKMRNTFWGDVLSRQSLGCQVTFPCPALNPQVPQPRIPPQGQTTFVVAFLLVEQCFGGLSRQQNDSAKQRQTKQTKATPNQAQQKITKKTKQNKTQQRQDT